MHPADDPPLFPEHPGTFSIPSAEASPSTQYDEAPPAAPRLRRTKTLGQTDYASAPAPAAPGQVGAGPTVIVNNNIQQTTTTVVAPAFLPGQVAAPSFGGARVAPAARGGSGAAPGGTPPVGGDWPQVPSYGPR
jgi:hypothetical protein